MKVAYVAVRIQNPTSGVYWKTLQQAAAARSVGLDCDFYFLHTGHESYNSRNVNCIRIEPSGTRLGKSIQTAFLQYSVLARHADLEKYDRIVLRHLKGGHLSYRSFFGRYPGKVLSEHHTKETTELSVERSGLCSLLGESLLTPRVLAHCIGIIGVTDEIRDYQCRRLNRPIPSETISNGVTVDVERQTGFQRFDGRHLTLVFVAARFRPWHGLDRLVNSLRHYHGPVFITVKLVGEVGGSDLIQIQRLSNPNTQIEIVSARNGDELDAFVARANLAISSLALDRSGLTQGCVLKTRQYMANGIPFFYGYQDCDIEPGFDLALRINTAEGVFDLEPIINFATEVSCLQDVSERMRLYAHTRMDWKCKIRQMYDFATGIG